MKTECIFVVREGYVVTKLVLFQVLLFYLLFSSPVHASISCFFYKRAISSQKEEPSRTFCNSFCAPVSMNL